MEAWIVATVGKLYYFLEAGDNVGVFPSILQVELPVRRPEVVVVDWGEGGVAQLGEDPLRVDTWTGGHSSAPLALYRIQQAVSQKYTWHSVDQY